MAKSMTEFSMVCKNHCEKKTVVVIGDKATVCLRVAFLIKRVILLLTLSFNSNILYSVELKIQCGAKGETNKNKIHASVPRFSDRPNSVKVKQLKLSNVCTKSVENLFYTQKNIACDLLTLFSGKRTR